MKRIVSFLLIALFLIVPVGAASSSDSNVEYVQKSSFWTWVAGKGKPLNGIIGNTFGAVCPNSEDGYHHASSYERPIGNWTVESGYYKCICDLCGAEFKAYEKDLQQSYDAQVAELPATGYQSDGSLLWSPKASYMWCGNYGGSFYAPFYPSGVKIRTPEELSFVPTFDFDKLSVSCKVFLEAQYFSINSVGVKFEDTYPIHGFYSRIRSLRFSYHDIASTNFKEHSNTFMYDRDSTPVACNAGASYSKSEFFIESSAYTLYSFSLVGYPPIFKVTPVNSSDIPDTTYNINSRPGVMLGMYGDVNGSAFSNNSFSIVNETNNTYTNPSTGATDTITDWSYNYSTRTYTLTLGGGTTTTVTYGDENVVIKEGDTTYNIYYLVNGSGSENPDPGTDPDTPPVCDHTWTETSRTDPTCTTAGKVTSTCSKCNQTKTETVPATGHSWVVDRTVQTTYDEEGNLLQQGYTIYSCSVCGEQYKDMEGTGPPGQEEEKSIWEKIGDLIGTIGGGFIDIIGAIAGKLLDALTKLAEMLMGKLKTVVETVLSIFDEVPALFGGFLDFLGAIFPFLPPEITTILTFGVIAITFIGILKAVRR